MDPRDRKAGEFARSYANQLGWHALTIIVGSLLVLGMAFFAFHGRGLTLVAIEVAAIAAMVAADRYFTPKFEHRIQGAEGEEAVGEILDRLSDFGWRVLHDVSLGRGNIDHVLVGPGGIFTVETKSHRGRYRVSDIDLGMLKQAYAQKKLIERITGCKRAEPLLVFSQAWLIGRVPARQNGVTVLPARMLESYIARQRSVVQQERVDEFYGHLADALAIA